LSNEFRRGNGNQLKMKKITHIFLLGVIAVITLSALGCQQSDQNPYGKPVPIDLEQIRQRGKLIAITGYSATTYFVYRGQPMGYDYELLMRLGDFLGLPVEIKIARDLSTMFRMLNAGEGDLLAYYLTVTQNRQKFVDFTESLFTTRQVLVQRKPKNWRQMKLHQIEKKLIRNPINLAGKTIYVLKASAHAQRLRHLEEEIGGNIQLVEVDGDTSSVDLIQMVAEGKIDYTVADEHVAVIFQAYYDNLDISTALSLPQRIAWAVRKTSPQLREKINEWLSQMKRTTDFYVIYNKYYRNRRAFRERIRSDYYSLTGDKISPWDDLIKERAKILGWDWRLLAALIYQESQFNPRKRSWVGAVGLMQLMPRTARELGYQNLLDPKINIMAGTEYLKWLDDYWKSQGISDPGERIKFVLASYNVGLGHVEDARKLAIKYGKNPDKWDDNVEYYLLQKSKPEFYNDEVVEYGYARGEEPVNYVKEVLERFHQYQQLIS